MAEDGGQKLPTESAGSEAVSVEFDWDGEVSASSIVLDAIEEFSGQTARTLKPLHEAVDVDALNQLFQSRPDGSARPRGSVALVVDDYRVTVYAEGFVVVQSE